MPYNLPDGAAVLSYAEFAEATGCPAAHLATLTSDAAPFHFHTPRSLVQSFDYEAFSYGSGVWKHVRHHEKADVHPALLAYFRDPYRAQATPLAALAADGFDPDAPLNDEALAALLGPAVARIARTAFRQAAFYTEDDVERTRAAYAVTLADMEREAERNRRAAEARKTRGPSQADHLDTFAPILA